jgi:SAM-dependent methyltransferase
MASSPFVLPSSPDVYDRIGRSYSDYRRPDLRIAARIEAALGDARTICNVGAGTGSYEPSDRDVVAVEPSGEMIRQRGPFNGSDGGRVVRAVAERLPFPDGAFDAALAVLTLHHWEDRAAGLAELRRIARRCVIFTFDPERQADFWLVRDYVPVSDSEDEGAPRLSDVVAGLGGHARVEPVPVPWDCTDGFQAAYWRRPERYLEPGVRASISRLAQLDPAIVDAAMVRLADDLETGRWHRRYGHLLARAEMDWGYRLVVVGAD